MVGSVSQCVDGVFNQVTESITHRGHRARQLRYRKDIKEFVEEYMPDDPFNKHPGRNLEGFEHFQFSDSIKNPAKLKSRLIKYSAKLDLLTDVIGGF